eukprot:SAG11_NODE_13575_length_650_cov_0.698182_1_plen_107_part_00
MATDHAEWNAAIGIPCEFYLLNAQDRDEEPHRVDAAAGGVRRQIEELQLLLQRNRPGGVTPLSDRVTRIAARLRQQRAALVDAGQKVVLVIATDGLPTTKNSGHSR